MSAPLISVIIPAYNVAPYIVTAIKSVLNQTFENIEVLVVDDGSTDETASYIDALAKTEARLHVFHTNNQGAPAARNFAMQKAAGKYIHFFDADDEALPTMLKDEVSFAEEHDLDLVMSGFVIQTQYAQNEEPLKEVKTHPTAIYQTQEAFRKDAYKLFDQNLLYVPWNKLFSRARIEKLGIEFKNTFWDDFPFVLDFIRDVEKVGVLQGPYYQFKRERPESETARYRAEMYQKREEEHGWMLDLYKHWGLLSDVASQEMIQRRYIERLVGCIENATCEQSPYKGANLRTYVKTIISTSQARKALRIAQPRSAMMRAMLLPLKMQNATLAIWEGKIISHVKAENTKLFARLKASR